MRGLKPGQMDLEISDALVASFTDAWIETIAVGVPMIELASHPLRMRGLKHIGIF